MPFIHALNFFFVLPDSQFLICYCREWSKSSTYSLAKSFYQTLLLKKIPEKALFDVIFFFNSIGRPQKSNFQFSCFRPILIQQSTKSSCHTHLPKLRITMVATRWIQLSIDTLNYRFPRKLELSCAMFVLAFLCYEELNILQLIA